MPRSFAVELAEMPDVIESNGRLSQFFIVGVHCLGLREVENGPEQHRRVAIGENEAITIRPDGILRIETHNPVP